VGCIACESSTTRPILEGSLALSITRGDGAGAAVDEGRIHIEGGGSSRVVSITPGTTRTIDGLTPGTYTVALEGLTGGQVETFGETTGVIVTAGHNTVANVQMNSFGMPVVNGVPTLVRAGQTIPITFTAVPGATGYRVETDANAAFPAPVGRDVAVTSTELPAAAAGTLYIRVRAKTRFNGMGRPGTPIPLVINPAVGITVTPTAPSTVIGGTVQFAATVTGSQNTLVTWRSSNPQIASVSATGLATALAAGTVTITAISAADTTGRQDATLTVAKPTLSLQPRADTVFVGGTAQLIGTVANAVNTGVQWRSSNTAIATVNATGLVTGIAQGTATITAIAVADTTVKETATLLVQPAPRPIVTIDPKDAAVTVGGTRTFVASVTASVDTRVNWRSSNTAVATVAEGVATGVTVGTAKIYAIAVADTMVRDSATLVVTPRPTISITPTVTTLVVDATEQFRATVRNATDTTVIWRSSDTTRVTVSALGVATGRAAGEALVTAIARADTTVKVSAAVTVVARQFTITASSIRPWRGTAVGGGTIEEGASATVTATPANRYDFLRWTEDGVSVSTSATYTFDVRANRNLVAHFAAQVAPPTPYDMACHHISGTRECAWNIVDSASDFFGAAPTYVALERSHDGGTSFTEVARVEVTAQIYRLSAIDPAPGATTNLYRARSCNEAGCTTSAVVPVFTEYQAPVISSLRTSVSGVNNCTTGGQIGTLVTSAFNYADADADVPFQIPIQYSWRFSATRNGSFTLTGSRQAPTASAGVAMYSVCHVFGTDTQITETIAIYDAAGMRSNELTVVTPRPAGANLRGVPGAIR
jgi:uncharacterized protein YjdB